MGCHIWVAQSRTRLKRLSSSSSILSDFAPSMEEHSPSLDTGLAVLSDHVPFLRESARQWFPLGTFKDPLQHLSCFL